VIGALFTLWVVWVTVAIFQAHRRQNALKEALLLTIRAQLVAEKEANDSVT
jgi:hypothetical protein